MNKTIKILASLMIVCSAATINLSATSDLETDVIETQTENSTKKVIITGVDDITVEWGSTFDPYAGVEVISSIKGGGGTLKISGTVNTKSTGTKSNGKYSNKTYTLKYTAVRSGEVEATATRKVTVKYYKDVKNTNGTFYRYYYNGSTLERRTLFSKDKKVKQHKYYRSDGIRYYNYYSNGKYSKTQIYNSSGKLTDTKEYYSNGRVKSNYDYYSNGRVWKRYTYNTNGKKTTFYERYNVANGQYKRYYNYYANGSLSKTQIWSTNSKRTDYKEYYTNGKKKSDYSYYTNGKVKKRVLYYSNGKFKEIVSYYSNGKPKQIIKYNSNGKITSKKSYANTSSSTNSSTKTIGNMNAYETEIFNEINAWRKANGYTELKHSNEVHNFADQEVKASSHLDPHPVVGREEILKNWRGFAFNEASCLQTCSISKQNANSWVTLWANSPGHRANMSGDWDYMSIAYDNDDIQVMFTKGEK